MSLAGAAFPYLTADEASMLDARMQRRRFRSGELILAEGDRRRALFVVLHGRARVEQEYMGARVPIAQMVENEIFGEMSFLEDEGATASVVADGECEVSILDSAELDPLLASDAILASHFYRSLAVRLSKRVRDRSRYLFPALTEG